MFFYQIKFEVIVVIRISLRYITNLFFIAYIVRNFMSSWRYERLDPSSRLNQALTFWLFLLRSASRSKRKTWSLDITVLLVSKNSTGIVMENSFIRTLYLKVVVLKICDTVSRWEFFDSFICLPVVCCITSSSLLNLLPYLSEVDMNYYSITPYRQLMIDHTSNLDTVFQKRLSRFFCSAIFWNHYYFQTYHIRTITRPEK